MTGTRKTFLGSLPLAGGARRLASRLRARLAPRRTPAAAETLDLYSPEYARDPFPFYEALRPAGSVHFLPRNGCWLVTGYEDVQWALARPRVFSNAVADWRAFDALMLGADPPGHTAARRVSNPHFPHQHSAELAAFAEGEAERLLRPLAAGAPCDVLIDFAAPLAEAAAARLVGFDEEALAAVRAAEGAARDIEGRLSALDAVIEGAAGRTTLYGELMRSGDWEHEPADVRSLVRLFWLAGTATTRRAIAASALMLLRHTSLRPRVASDPDALAAFLEETLRLLPPEHLLPRRAVTEVELSGVKIPEGALVRLCVAAANRDPAKFKDPETFLPGRTFNRHLSFGGGIHRCIGAGLARTVTAGAARTLLRLAPEFRAAVPLDALPFQRFVNDSERLVIEP